jgi:opacity protein-like surface antigen
MSRSFANGARVALALLLLLALPRSASADWLLTPYVGVVFGGDANTLDIDDLDDEFRERFNIGGSITFMGGGVFGFEIDYSFSPNFFQITEGGEDIDIPLLDIDSSLSTLMANAIVGIPVGGTTGGGVRPYVTGGIGLMRANISVTDLFDDLSTNELGVNFGGGVHVFFSDNVGLRGDLRYFRALDTDDDNVVEDLLAEEFGLADFDYWRATIGVTFRFGG